MTTAETIPYLSAETPVGLGKFNGRNQPTDRTAFIFRGHALGDLALAALAFRKFSEG